MGLGALYGTARWHWAPCMVWPCRQDWLPSMAQLDGTGCPVWHGLIGLEMDWASSLARLAMSPSALDQWPPVPQDRAGTPARHSQWSQSCIGTRVTQGCHILRPGCSQGCHVPGLGCPQGCHIPSRMGLSPRASHPSTRGILRDVPSQGKCVPGASHPRTGFSQECHTPYWDVTRNIHPAGTGLSGWGPWRW